MPSLRTETETVVKKILPYLERRGYDIVKDLDFETRIDADVMAWLKEPGKGYQTRLNAILREAMLRELHRK